jgi:hypothetical protein
MLENWKEKGGCLSAARHRTSQNVAAFEGNGNGFGLNWSGTLEAELFETFVETRMKL